MSALWWRLIRLGFRLLYNELAFTYDLVSKLVSLGAWRCWQRAALRYLEAPPVALVLEVAHGTGDMQLDLTAAGYRTVGIDLSRYMGRIARRKLRKHGQPALLVCGPAQKLPFRDTAFAAVVSTFPTDFIIAPDTLQEIHRVLQPGGQFVIVPNGVLTGGAGVMILETLYRITGQRHAASWDTQGFFAAFGFEARTARVRCPHSVALVIAARKKV